MKKQGVIGLVVGIAAGVAAAVAGGLATAKVVKEIKNDIKDSELISPDGNNKITLSCGASDFAKGLTYIKINAKSEALEDECKLSVLAGKKGAQSINCEWTDNEHFELTIGNGKLRQCCDVSFEDEQIVIYYYWVKITVDDNGETVEKVVTEAPDVEEETV